MVRKGRMNSEERRMNSEGEERKVHVNSEEGTSHG